MKRCVYPGYLEKTHDPQIVFYYPWARRGVVVPFVRRLSAASFSYCSNMVQHIELIIYTNIQPLRQGQGQRFKKIFYNSKNNYRISNFLREDTHEYGDIIT